MDGGDGITTLLMYLIPINVYLIKLGWYIFMLCVFNTTKKLEKNGTVEIIFHIFILNL